jgi:hypothetical protein
MFDYFIALIRTTYSDDLESFLLSYPAITKSDFTALKPKS